MVSVQVRDNDVDQALKALKKKMQREGVFQEQKAKRHFKSAGEKRREAEASTQARWNKKNRKQEQKTGESTRPYG